LAAPTTIYTASFIHGKQYDLRGAHLLLQVRTRAPNEELRDRFDEWYPGFNKKSEDQARDA
jgi:hypothetical protein